MNREDSKAPGDEVPEERATSQGEEHEGVVAEQRAHAAASAGEAAPR